MRNSYGLEHDSDVPPKTCPSSCLHALKTYPFRFHLCPGAICPFWRWLRVLWSSQAPAKQCYCWTINDKFLGGLKWGGKPTESQYNPMVLQLQSSVDERLPLAKRAHGNAFSLYEWYINGMQMGVSLLAKFITFFILKPEEKSLTCLLGEGSQLYRKEKKSQVLSNLWHFRSAPGSGLGPHFCTGQSALLQGREEKKGSTEMEMGE